MNHPYQLRNHLKMYESRMKIKIIVGSSSNIATMYALHYCLNWQDKQTRLGNNLTNSKSNFSS